MRTIWKFELATHDYVELQMPKGASVLSVGHQYGKPHLWALVDPDAKMEKRAFRHAGTGHPITESDSRLSFIGTYMLDGGALVFHVFEVLP